MQKIQSIIGLFLLLASPCFADEDYSQYAAPALPQELSEKIQGYFDIRSPSAGLLDPSGRQLFFTWNVTGTSQIWRLDGPKSFPVQLTGGEMSTSVNDITPDGKWLIVSRDRNGEENPGIYKMSPRGGGLEVIQHKSKVQTSFEFISRDSKWVYYRSNDIRPDAYAIYRYSLVDGKRELLFSEPGLWTISDYKNDGTLLLSKSLGNFQNEIYEWSPVTKKLKPLLGQGEVQAYMAMYGARKGELLVNTYKFGEFFTLYSWMNGKYTQVSKKLPWDVDDFITDRQKRRLLYVTNENGFQHLHALDARTYKPIALPSFKDAEHVSYGYFNSSGSQVMIIVNKATAPRVSYSYEFGSEKLQQWVIPSSPEIDTSHFAKAELEFYPARDGTKIPMLVRRPEKCLKELCPVIVEFHGGPEGQATPGFSPYAQLFIDEGFVLVEPNVRGSMGYGRTWLDSDNGPKRLNVITDIEDVSKFIRESWKKNGVAPKLGVMGGSYGGYSTNVAMTIFAGAYDAGSANVGMSNLITFIANTAPYRRALRMSEYGNPEKDREAMEKLSPIFSVDKIRAPLQLIQGANDPRVPVGEAVQMLQKMKDKKIPGSLIVFADEGHGASKRGNRVLSVGNVLLFFKKHLLGK
ncbi:MAG TPA: prolyl oligopeptidase family serine peptidase [Bdellovibrionota bacterium]|jgi:protease II